MSSPPKRQVSRVGVISLGCSKNLVDTEVMLGHLDRAGFEFVRDPAEADVIVVNTCGFIEAAREESIRTILEVAQHKETGRLKRLVVAGCMVQRYRDELRSQLPEVDAFIGLDQLEQVVAQVEPVGRANGSPAALESDLPLVGRGPVRLSAAMRKHAANPATAPWSPAAYLYDDRTPRRLATPSWTGYVKIAEGCDHTCTFCAIPGFRGRFRSRRPESIVREAERLAASGLRELNLIAQDSSHYGRDHGAREGLSRLLEQLHAVDGLRWIRLHYLYPNTITDHLVETMARLPRVVNYVDLPLQHAHSQVLRRMRRGGSAQSHRRLLRKFRRAMSDATLRTTFIVGFPGESEEEFEALLEFVRETRFDHVGVFTYSHEAGTAAGDMQDDVSDDRKQDRFRRLMECQQRIVFDRNAGLIGRRVEVLVEGTHAETEHLLVGRTSSQAPDVDGQVLINDGAALPGEFVQVELTETAGYDLVGTIVGPA